MTTWRSMMAVNGAVSSSVILLLCASALVVSAGPIRPPALDQRGRERIELRPEWTTDAAESALNHERKPDPSEYRLDGRIQYDQNAQAAANAQATTDAMRAAGESDEAEPQDERYTLLTGRTSAGLFANTYRPPTGGGLTLDDFDRPAASIDSLTWELGRGFQIGAVQDYRKLDDEEGYRAFSAAAGIDLSKNASLQLGYDVLRWADTPGELERVDLERDGLFMRFRLRF